MSLLTGPDIGYAYGYATGVLGARSWPEPTCHDCGDDLPDVDMDIDEDGRAVLLVCDACAGPEPEVAP